MASVQTAQGTITVRNASEVAAMLDAGMINVSQAGQLQVELAGGGEIVAPPTTSGPGVNQNLALRQTVPTPGLQPPTGASNIPPPFQAAPFTNPPPVTGGGSTGAPEALLNQLLGPQLGPQAAGDVTPDRLFTQLKALDAAFQRAMAMDNPERSAIAADAIVKQAGIIINQLELLQNSVQFDTETKNTLEIARKEQATKLKDVENALKQQNIISEGRIEEEEIRIRGSLADIQARQRGQNVTQQTANQGLLNVQQSQNIGAADLQALLNKGTLGVQGLQNTGAFNLQTLLNQGNLGTVNAQGQKQLLLQQLLNQGGLAGIQAQGGTDIEIANIQAAAQQAALENQSNQFLAQLGLDAQLGLGGLGIQQGQLDLNALLGGGNLGLGQNRLLLDQLLGTGQLDLGQGQLDLNRLLGVGGLGFDFSQLAQQQTQFATGIEQQMAQRAEESRQFNEQNARLLQAAQLQLQGQLGSANISAGATTQAAGIRAGSERAQLEELRRQFGITQPEGVRQFDVGTQTDLTALLSNQQNQAIANPFGAFALNLLGGNALGLPDPSAQRFAPPTGIPPTVSTAQGGPIPAFSSTETNVTALLDPNRKPRAPTKGRV